MQNIRRIPALQLYALKSDDNNHFCPDCVFYTPELELWEHHMKNNHSGNNAFNNAYFKLHFKLQHVPFSQQLNGGSSWMTMTLLTTTSLKISSASIELHRRYRLLKKMIAQKPAVRLKCQTFPVAVSKTRGSKILKVLYFVYFQLVNEFKLNCCFIR